MKNSTMKKDIVRIVWIICLTVIVVTAMITGKEIPASIFSFFTGLF